MNVMEMEEAIELIRRYTIVASRLAGLYYQGPWVRPVTTLLVLAMFYEHFVLAPGQPIIGLFDEAMARWRSIDDPVFMAYVARHLDRFERLDPNLSEMHFDMANNLLAVNSLSVMQTLFQRYDALPFVMADMDGGRRSC